MIARVFFGFLGAFIGYMAYKTFSIPSFLGGYLSCSLSWIAMVIYDDTKTKIKNKIL